jgi:hypothetical protein
MTPAVAVAAPDRKTGGVPSTVTSAETRETADLPRETSEPTLDSTHLRVGSTLRALAGSWTSGTQFTYQWFAAGEAISGATRSTFTPTAAQLGKRLWVRLDGFLEGFVPASRTSEPSSPVLAGDISQGRPVIVGNATPGATLTVTRPPAVPAPDSVSYRWRLDRASIRGANRSELTVRSDWRVSPRPVIAGTVRVGSTLTAIRGAWSPTPSSFSFQWYADGRPISGATASKYTLRGSDYKKEITVSARSYRAGYGTVLRRSAATDEVLASAVRWVSGRILPVGPDGVAPATYIAQAGATHCFWERYVSPDVHTDPNGSSNGSGQRVFDVLDTDSRVGAEESCGVWIKYYPGTVRTSDATAANGAYVLGDHLERGVYSTAGPAVGGGSCGYSFYKGFYGDDAQIGGGAVTEAATITTPDSAVGFETRNCIWKRIG